MGLEYVNGHRVIERGASDGFDRVKLCQKAVDRFYDWQSKVSKD